MLGNGNEFPSGKLQLPSIVRSFIKFANYALVFISVFYFIEGQNGLVTTFERLAVDTGNEYFTP